MSGDSKARQTLQTLTDDVRQGAVGGIVALAIPVIGAVLLAALGGDVPAWTLAIAVAISSLVVIGVLAHYSRKFGRIEGSLQSEVSRRETAEEELTRLAPAASESVPAMTANQEGLIFRIKSLRGDLQERRSGRRLAGHSEVKALCSLAVDIRDHLGPTGTLDSIVQEWEIVKSAVVV